MAFHPTEFASFTNQPTATSISQLYLALFARAPDSEGLAFWTALVAGGTSVSSITNTMLATAPARLLYPETSTAAGMVRAFYTNVLGREPDAQGLAYWTQQFQASGGDFGSVMASLINAVNLWVYFAGTPEAEAGLASKQLFDNRVAVAQHFAQTGGKIADATKVLTGVTADAATVTRAKANIDSGHPDRGATPGAPVGPDPIVFIVYEDAATHAITYGGDASGPVTVTTNGTLLTFVRAGVTASTKPAIASLAGGGIPAVPGVEMTAETFATAGLAQKLSDGSVTLGAVTSDEAAVAANIAKVAAGGITSVTLTGAQLKAISDAAAVTKLADASVSLTGSVSLPAEVTVVLAAVAKLKAGGVADLELTAAQLMTAGLLPKLAAGSVTLGNVTTNVADVLANLAKLKDGGITGITLTSAQFAAAGVTDKLAAGAATLGNVTTNVADVVAHIGKVKDSSISAVTLTVAQFTTAGVLDKLGTGAASLDATGAAGSELASIAAGIAKVADGGITGTLALNTVNLDAAGIAALLGPKTSGTATVNVDATAMTPAELSAVAAGIAKVSAVSNLSVTSALGATEIAGLLGKAGSGAVTVNAAGMDAASLSAVSNAIAKISSVTGLTVGSGQSAAEIGNLLGKAAAGAVQVDAASMSAAQLSAIAAGIAKVDAITHLTVTAADQSDAETADLLGKAAAGTAQVNATGASATEIATIVANAAHIQTKGITGTGLTLTATQSAALGTKLADAVTDVQVDTSGATPAQLAAIVADLDNVASLSGSLAITNAVAAADITALFAKYNGTTATVDATSMSAAHHAALAGAIGKISGITHLALELNAVSDAATGALLGKATGATVVATGGTAAEVASLVSNLGNIAANGISGDLAFGNAVASADITALLGKYAGTTATVNAAAMSGGQLSAVGDAAAIAQVGAINGLSFAASAIGNSTTANLLGKAAASSAQVDATSATASQIGSLVTHAANLQAKGISGTGVTLTAEQFSALGTKLADGMTVVVGASGATAAQLSDVLADIDNVGSITGLAVGSSQNSTQLGTLMNKAGNGSVSVNASGMDGTQLTTISSNIGKVSSLTNLSLTAADLGDTVFHTLLGRAPVSTARVEATGATAAQVSSMVTYFSSIASAVSNGITGNLPVSNALTDTQISTLFVKYNGTSAIVDATAMSQAQLDVVGGTAVSAKTGSITGLSVTASGFAQATLANLLSKSVAGTAQVNASGAGASLVETMATYVANIANNGITGTLALTSTQTDTAITALLGKYGGTTATAIVSSMSAAQLNALAGAAGKFAANGITGTLTITSGVPAAAITDLFGKYGSTNGQANAAGMTTAQLAALGNVDTNKISIISNISGLDLGDALITDTVTANLLAKAGSGVGVVATGASATELSALASSYFKLAANGVTGVLSITSALGATGISELFGKYGGTAAIVDASGMTVAQLAAVSGATSKIASGGIANLQLTLSDSVIDDSVTSSLLSKAAAGTAAVVATGASAAEVGTLATYIDNIAAITGTLAVGNAQSEAGLSALFGKYTGTTATVNAASMTSPQLAAVGGAAAKIGAGGITSLTLNLADVTDGTTGNLLSKASNAMVVATGGSATESARMATYSNNIAAGGISGDMLLTNGLVAVDIITLFNKYSGNTAVVNASGMSTTQLAAVYDSITKVGAGGITNLTLTDVQTENQINFMLNKASAALVNASGMNTAKLVKVAYDIGNVASISNLTLAAADFINSDTGRLLSKASGALVNATGATVQEVDSMATHASRIAADGLTGTIDASAALSYQDYADLANAINLSAVVTVSDTAGNLSGTKTLAKADKIAVLGSTFNAANDTDNADSTIGFYTGGVDSAGEWTFNSTSRTLTYYNGSGPVQLTLTGAVTVAGNGSDLSIYF